MLQPVDKFLKQKIASSIPEGSQPEEIVEAIYEIARVERGVAAEGNLLGFPDRSRWKTEKVLDWLLNNYLPNKTSSQLYEQYWMQSDRQIEFVLSKQGMDWLLMSIPSFKSQSCACSASWLDFCFSTLNLSHNQKKWEAFQAVIRECGWIFTHEKTCFICDRPIKLSFDEENQLHSEEEAAIQFADGFSVHVHHGVASIET
ncbi:hypothetical protein QUB80_08185 [Chlorogloeopsis sp. ULAP01]|uniref:DUF6745 domain-containing protein n=1 Tax=Chlorogloeopsis sp. ULAP01 TaxID=3056483 RepID=UPI0025AB50BA|nr:hypothetical protein [Chlorogloeopsis sp. ULAP01]MDM9380683.1 hypothetical protein [Chlorogloeopsis sp. ULAP01]